MKLPSLKFHYNYEVYIKFTGLKNRYPRFHEDMFLQDVKACPRENGDRVLHLSGTQKPRRVTWM